MDQNKSREVILGRICEALKKGGTGSNTKEINHSYNELYVHGEGSKAGLLAESASELGVRVIQCANVREFKRDFQKMVDLNGWEELNCADGALFKSLELDTLPLDWTDDTMDCNVAVTGCEIMVARTGTVVMDTSQLYGRILPVHTPVQVIVGYEDQLVYDLPDAIGHIHTKYRNRYPSALLFSSGVSSTGDIEKTLVRGVHGPKEVFLFLLNSKLSENAD